MRRRDFLLTIAGLPLAAPLPTRAQQGTRMPRIGALIGFAQDDPATQRDVAAFLAGLADSGWVAGRNVAIELRYGAGNAEKNRTFAKELVGLKPDVIFVNSTSATAAIQHETNTIPVVFATVSDPVGSGFVASLARPGGNMTGFVNVEASIAGKWVGLLKEVTATIRTVGLMYNPSTATYFEYYLKPFAAAADAAGLKHVALPVGSTMDIEQAFRSTRPGDGMIVMSDPFMTVNSNFINEKALQFRVPVVSGVSHHGSLISYAPNAEDLFRRSAGYVAKILRGTPPIDLPVQLPTKFDLVINMKAARVLGLTIPQTLIAQADEIIE